MDEQQQAEARIAEALKWITHYSGFDGESHKQWLLDKLVLILTGSPQAYQQWVDEYNGDGEYEPWDKGIAP